MIGKILFITVLFAGPVLNSEVTQTESERQVGTIYSPISKRDPFKTPEATIVKPLTGATAIEQYRIDQFALKAVLHNALQKKALILDPDGKSHVVSEGSIIGREKGRVSRILRREIIITEHTTNYLGIDGLVERVLSLPSEREIGGYEVSGGTDTSVVSQQPKGAALNSAVKVDQSSKEMANFLSALKEQFKPKSGLDSTVDSTAATATSTSSQPTDNNLPDIFTDKSGSSTGGQSMREPAASQGNDTAIYGRKSDGLVY